MGFCILCCSSCNNREREEENEKLEMMISEMQEELKSVKQSMIEDPGEQSYIYKQANKDWLIVKGELELLDGEKLVLESLYQEKLEMFETYKQSYSTN